MSFADHELDTDSMEYNLQPYYAQLLSFRLGVDTAYHEKQRDGQAWKIRYQYCRKNPKWNGSILYGQPGWEPADIKKSPGLWRSMQPVFCGRRLFMSVLCIAMRRDRAPRVTPLITQEQLRRYASASGA